MTKENRIALYEFYMRTGQKERAEAVFKGDKGQVELAEYKASKEKSKPKEEKKNAGPTDR